MIRGWRRSGSPASIHRMQLTPIGSGLGKVASGIGDAVASGARAAGDVTVGVLDIGAGIEESMLGVAVSVAAGVHIPVRPFSTRMVRPRNLSARESDSIGEDVGRYKGKAAKEFDAAENELFGSGPNPAAAPGAWDAPHAANSSATQGAGHS